MQISIPSDDLLQSDLPIEIPRKYQRKKPLQARIPADKPKKRNQANSLDPN